MNQQPQKQEVSTPKKTLHQHKKNKPKSHLEIIEHLFTHYTYPDWKLQQYNSDQDTHILETLLKNPPQHRTPKQLKKIKAELAQLSYFKEPPIKQTNPQFNEIFKRDNAAIIDLISSFMELGYYKKGRIVEVTAFPRNYIRFLLHGQAFVAQPINYKAYRNCEQKLKEKEYNMDLIKDQKLLMSETLLQLQRPPIELQINQMNETFLTQKSLIDEEEEARRKQELDIKISQKLEEEKLYMKELEIMREINQCITKQQSKILLKKCAILTPLTPHHFLPQKDVGNLICSTEQPFFIDQKPQYKSTTMCSTDCIFLEIQYGIAAEIIRLVNSNRDRPYILSLLYKFPMLKYFEAKQYVTQQYMLAEEEQEDEDGNKTLKKSKPVQFIKELKIINSFNFQIGYTGNMYLVIAGSISLVIDMISEKKPSNIEYIIPQKRKFPKEILTLFKNDIFGFEKIGQSKHANLRYLAKKGSKILKINALVLQQHSKNVQGFAECLTELKQIRNKMIKKILKNMDSTLQQQQVIRHEHITYKKIEQSTQRHKTLKPEVKQLRFLGHKNYQNLKRKLEKHFSPENTQRQKYNLSPQIVKQAGLGVQFSKNLMLKPNQKIQIKDGWIQIRNSKGDLLRKKKIREYDDIHHNDQLLRKLGILNSEQIANHNHQIVKKRQSKYEFDDIEKQRKQFKALRQKAKSLPRLTKFFSKKEDRLFSVFCKKNM